MITTLLLCILSQIISPVATSHAAPSPRPVLREKGIKVSPVNRPEVLVINPKVQAPVKKAEAKPELGKFTLSKAAGGKLLLRFQALQTGWEMSPKHPLVIQLDAPEGIEIEPSVITREQWPAAAKEITLTYKSSISASKSEKIGGGASYTICEIKTKTCRKALNRFSFTL